MVLRSLLVLLAASAGIVGSSSALTAETVTVRVVSENVSVLSRPSRDAEVMAAVKADALLEVINKEGNWFWVLVDRDNHGTQRAGWIRANDVEVVGEAARFFVMPEPEAVVVEEAVADVPVEVEQTARVEEPAKPKKVDDRRLRKAEQELEKARRAMEKLQMASPIVAEPPTTAFAGEPIFEPALLLQH